jgi:hypothetical protein
MALSTTDLAKEGGSGLPKTIAPGNHVLKINSVALEEFKFIANAYHLVINVETEPIDGFDGFLIDKDNESLGRYAGQIGRVKASQYAFADGKTKTGIEVQRDRSILIFLQKLCKTLSINDWFVAQDDKHDTIEEFIEAFNNDAPFKDKYFDACVAGKEYEGKSGYTNYDMWFPKDGKGVYSIAPKGGSVLQYDEETHLKKMETKEVTSFGDDDLDIPKRAASDFSLD